MPKVGDANNPLWVEPDILRFFDKLKIKTQENVHRIWDESRRKYILLTPEEQVRQLFIQYLVHDIKIKKGRISVEKKLISLGMDKRFDIVVFDSKGSPLIIVECKAPHVAVNQKVMDQIVSYNQALSAPYLIVTNGLGMYITQILYLEKDYRYITALPNEIGDY